MKTETKERNKSQISFNKKKTKKQNSIKSTNKEQVTEEEKKLQLFQGTLQTIFKEIKKYDNPKSFPENDPKISETNRSNKNIINIIEQNDSNY